MSLRKEIKSQLPLTVHDYMQLCLQHPEYGYYRNAKAVGKEGDFTTAPEISQIFGDLIGLWLRDIWQQMGESPFALVELGPGRGTLCADALRMLPECALHLVESNETLKEQQKQTLWQYQPTWHADLSTLPSDLPLLIIANEFLDAFPIRQFVGEEERRVDENFTFLPEGEVTKETCPMAEKIMQQICQRLKAQNGVFLTIDYGYANGENGDTLQAVKDHQYHDPLKDCGEVDLTAHVNFQALQRIAEAEICSASPIVTQEKFLRSLGGDIWLQKLLQKTTDQSQQKMLEDGWLRLISNAQMGSLFKVLAVQPNNQLTLSGFN